MEQPKEDIGTKNARRDTSLCEVSLLRALFYIFFT